MEDQSGFDLGFLRVELEGQIHSLQNEVGRPIVFQMNDLASICPHGQSRSRLATGGFVEGACDGEKAKGRKAGYATRL
ncbi:hypothetical protein D3C86_1872510 [compost metagenome]